MFCLLYKRTVFAVSRKKYHPNSPTIASRDTGFNQALYIDDSEMGHVKDPPSQKPSAFKLTRNFFKF